MQRTTILVILFVLLSAQAFALSDQDRVVIPLDNSPSQGPVNAPVTIIEFIDFQ